MEQNIKQNEANYAWIFPALVLLVGAIYAYFSFTAPTTASGEKLGLGGTKLFLIKITFTLPFIATWYIGAIAAQNLKHYAARVTDPSIARGYGHLATGITFLVAGTLVAQIVGLPRNFYEGNTDVIALISVMTNYINVFFPLIGFLYFFRGAKQFSASDGGKSDVGTTSGIIAALLGGIYILLVFTNTSRQVSLTPDFPPTYYISDIFIIATIIIPILIAWFFGFRAALTMGEIQTTRTFGQKGFLRLMNGIWLVVFSSIILQGIVSLGSARFLALGIGVTLAVIYFFLVIVGAGYWLAASGSKKLLDSSQS